MVIELGALGLGSKSGANRDLPRGVSHPKSNKKHPDYSGCTPESEGVPGQAERRVERGRIPRAFWDLLGPAVAETKPLGLASYVGPQFLA